MSEEQKMRHQQAFADEEVSSNINFNIYVES